VARAADWPQQGADAGMRKYSAPAIAGRLQPEAAYTKQFYPCWAD
jgi:hypothetical protein